MPANNDYAYQQVLGSLHRRGATVTKEDLKLTGQFFRHLDAELCWRALHSKYPSDGPNAVTVTRSEAGTFIYFNFAGVPAPG